MQWQITPAGRSLILGTASLPAAAQCVDYSKDPAGCQPSASIPIGQMPSVRVNRDGKLDPASSEETPGPVAKLEKDLHLFRNVEHLHWVSRFRPLKIRDGCMERRRPRRSGRRPRPKSPVASSRARERRGPQARHQYFQIQPNPEKQPPVQVGEIPAMFEGNQGFDDRELRSLVYKTSKGEDRYIMVRNAGTNTIGRMETYRIDPNTCLPIGKSEITDFGGQSHEFFMWHDPANSNRILIYMTNWTSGLPDPDHPGLKTPDLTVLAVTDEDTGEMLPKAKPLATFTLQEVGGPPVNEKPDATGLFSDGRFLDFSDSKNLLGRAGNFQNNEQNASLPPQARVRRRHHRRILRSRFGCSAAIPACASPALDRCRQRQSTPPSYPLAMIACTWCNDAD
jgi:hypothetical protein